MRKDRFKEMSGDLYKYKIDIYSKEWKSTEEFLQYFLDKYNIILMDIK